MKKIQLYKVEKNVDSELMGRKIDRAEKACLINSDKYMISSDARSSFFELKKEYQDQIDRLMEQNIELTNSLETLKEKHHNEVIELDSRINFLNNELQAAYRGYEKTFVNQECQTEIDMMEFRKMHMNHDSVVFIKSLVINLVVITYRIRIN